MSERYIGSRFDRIKQFADAAEARLDDADCTPETRRRENVQMLEQRVRCGVEYLLIDEEYRADVRL